MNLDEALEQAKKIFEDRGHTFDVGWLNWDNYHIVRRSLQCASCAGVIQVEKHPGDDIDTWKYIILGKPESTIPPCPAAPTDAMPRPECGCCWNVVADGSAPLEHCWSPHCASKDKPEIGTDGLCLGLVFRPYGYDENRISPEDVRKLFCAAIRIGQRVAQPALAVPDQVDKILNEYFTDSDDDDGRNLYLAELFVRLIQYSPETLHSEELLTVARVEAALRECGQLPMHPMAMPAQPQPEVPMKFVEPINSTETVRYEIHQPENDRIYIGVQKNCESNLNRFSHIAGMSVSPEAATWLSAALKQIRQAKDG